MFRRSSSSAWLLLRRRAPLCAAAGLGLAATPTAPPVRCHGGHSHAESARLAQLEEEVKRLSALLQDVQQTTGQGDAVFSWERQLTAAFPEEARPFEADMHGGFTEDPATGVVYTGIPGYGLCSISPDLRTWRRVGEDPRLKDNIHGLACFRHGGKTLLALAQPSEQRILLLEPNGNVLQQLDAPKGGEFHFAEANHYYSRRPREQCMSQHMPEGKGHVPEFAVTDVAYLQGRLYATTGYCDGDFVLTAMEEGGTWRWGPLAWGGRGSAPGQFSTAHGVFAHEGHIFVASREAHEILEFTAEGKLVRALPDLPEAARVCNVARADDYFVFNALEPIRSTPAKTAAIFAHDGEHLLSVIQPGELGIPVLKHLHHVWPHYVTEKGGARHLHLLVHGWRRGKFAVLKHEPEGLR